MRTTRDSNRFIVLDAGASAIKALLVVDGQPSEHVSLDRSQAGDPAEALRQLRGRDNVWKKAPVHLVLTDNRTRSYTLKFPYSSDKAQIEASQANAIERAMGGLGSTYEIRANTVKDDGFREQLAVAVARSGLEAAKPLKARTITANGMHAHGALPATEQARALIDIGSAHTVVSLVEEGATRRVKTLSMGSDSFSDALIGMEGIDTFEQAERLKRESQLGEGEAGARMQAVADQLMQMLASTLDEYRSHGTDLKRAALTGGGARLAGLADSFDRFLGVRCSLLETELLAGEPPHEMLAAWLYAQALLNTPAKRVPATIDFTPRGKRARREDGQDQTGVPGFVIDRHESTQGRQRSMLAPLLLIVAVVAALAAGLFILNEMTTRAQDDSLQAQSESRRLAANAELVAPQAFLDVNERALALAKTNDAQAQMIESIDRLTTLLGTEQLTISEWRSTSYDQITVTGSGELPPQLGERVLTRQVAPARIVDVRQDDAGFTIVVGAPQ